jgi:hypothetical protein
MRNNFIRFLQTSAVFEFIFASILIAQASAAGNGGIMKLEDIKDGMPGKAYSTMKGSMPVEYDIEIIGRVPNGLAPGMDLLLLRLSGPNIEKAGVFAGMSGSPFYIGDKLAGSISFQLGFFSKEIIAGATPAEYILDTATPLPEVQGTERLEFLGAFESSLFSQAVFNEPALQSLLPGYTVTKSQASNSLNIMKTLNLPLFSSGMNNDTISKFQGLIAGSGLRFMKTDSGQGSSTFKYQMQSANDFVQEIKNSETLKIVPGSPIYVPLIRGDVNIGASGTLTHIEDNNLFAFGHEFLRMGPVEFPIHSAKVLTVFPSDYEGFHIVAPGEEIGCVIDDRISGIHGVTNKRASMIPIEIQVRNKGNLIKKYNIETIQGRLAPILLWIASEAAVGNTFNLSANSTVKVKSIIQLEGEYDPVVIDSVFSGAGSASQATLLPAAALYLLETNPFESIKINSIKVNLDCYIRPLDAEITKIRYDKEEVSPGEKVGLKIYLKTWRGKTVVKTADLKIPSSFPLENIKIVIADADSVTKIENSGLVKAPSINDLKHMINIINSLKSKSIIYIQAYHLSQGIFEYGRFLNDLPLTALEVLKAKQTDGDVIQVFYSMLSEDRLETDFSITGKQSFNLTIKKKPETEEK